MRLNKKILITVAITIVVAVCGIIVYNTRTVPKMIVGNIYNGYNLRNVTAHKNSYEEFDIHRATELEQNIAKLTNVLISAMTLTDDNTGYVTLVISVPDIKSYITEFADDMQYSDKNDFVSQMKSKIETIMKKGNVVKRTEPYYIDVDMHFTNNRWIIIPTVELYQTLTGNLDSLIDELYNELIHAYLNQTFTDR